MWNLVIFEPNKRHCYLEGCYDDFDRARNKAYNLCNGNGREYSIMSETEYIQFRNPYF